MLICPMLLPVTYELQNKIIMFKNLTIKRIRLKLSADTSPSQAKSTVQCLDHPFHWWGKGYWANKSVSRDSISVGEKAVTKVTGARIKLL